MKKNRLKILIVVLLLAVALLTAGLVGALAGRPLGPKMQQHVTTDADVSDLSIVSINCTSLHGTPVFFVETALV